MTRLKAAVMHILISFFIITLTLATMYALWFPNAYFTLMGGLKLIALIAIIDVFLGPLLTFAIFKSGKKGLKFDLFCIGLVQLTALSYGVYVMFQARPIFTVFNKDKFQIAAVVDVDPRELAKEKDSKWKQLSITGPKLVAIGIPDKKNKTETMFAKIQTLDAYRYPRLYDEYAKHRNDVIKAGRPLTTLALDSIENKITIAKFLNKSHRPENDFLVLPISSELAEMSAIVDAKTGDFIEIIDAKPKIAPHKI